MEDEAFDNELSSDDEDYCPEKHKQNAESASENSGSDEECSEVSDEESTAKKTGKRKKAGKVHKAESAAEKKPENDPEQDKQKADAIWADFLNDTEAPTEPKKNGDDSTVQPAPSSTSSSSKPIIPTKVPAPASPSIAQKLGVGIKRPSGGGLSSVLNQLTKKNKVSVLEKTKLDWDGFKNDEGISEELQTHNRGREGFLQRRDFLERTDLRQFEIEKNLRMTRRK